MSKGTVTTTHSGRLSPGPFDTEAEARDQSDLPEGWAGPRRGFSVHQKTTDGKWWRLFWSTTTLPPLEEVKAQGPLRFHRFVLQREGGGDDTDSRP